MEIRRGDIDDPLAGVVRFSGEGISALDLVVGKSPWQAGILTRAREAAVEGVLVPVVTAADLILLKLYAGGPQDAWDIEQLLVSGNRAALIEDVDRGLSTLPASCRAFWQRVLGRSGERM